MSKTWLLLFRCLHLRIDTHLSEIWSLLPNSLGSSDHPHLTTVVYPIPSYQLASSLTDPFQSPPSINLVMCYPAKAKESMWNSSQGVAPVPHTLWCSRSLLIMLLISLHRPPPILAFRTSTHNTSQQHSESPQSIQLVTVEMRSSCLQGICKLPLIVLQSPIPCTMHHSSELVIQGRNLVWLTSCRCHTWFSHKLKN